MSSLNFSTLRLSELTPDQLLAILKLRSEVFVSEQHCVYNDPDTEDTHAIHVLGEQNGKVITYARMFCKEGIWHIGRVVVSQTHRGQGYSRAILFKCLDHVKKLGGLHVEVSAQVYLQGFYASLGFEPIGYPYLEDGIPHLRMTYPQSLTSHVQSR